MNRSTTLTQTYPDMIARALELASVFHRRTLTAVCNLSSRAGLTPV
ncbi:MAG: hypothetical protein O4805_00845 [Trichodesmium sp. St16_bin2-tuft]|nr:hypothetical protein [Trichodesmium sp. MAG_R02]MDE5074914.1 hypothetical protein [Trichodesmium sp. St5_bin2_1]MDE5084896.1 hypothetical protein [Trichodesmium sp. St18_bin1]MDE5085767.1 hypothetical protein [Trichodesmium sp. St16_bin2-tuft]MDE5116020.1 hypothetical protein [Trichodesmium sp. St2_bin2_1]MDE5119539.1 hypothetical protein [Trichodesmium sp. St19_bin1]